MFTRKDITIFVAFLLVVLGYSLGVIVGADAHGSEQALSHVVKVWIAFIGISVLSGAIKLVHHLTGVDSKRN